jgi:hypothetical protein
MYAATHTDTFGFGIGFPFYYAVFDDLPDIPPGLIGDSHSV